MKKILATMAFTTSALIFAQKSEIPEAVIGQQYGAGVSDAEVFNVYDTAQLAKELGEKDKLENIVLKAKVTAICEKKGCWLTLKNDGGETVFVKMKDYAFFLPQSIIGKTVLMTADAERKETSVDELRHYAKDAKKSAEEIAKITKPKKEIRVLAKGIKVVS